MPDPWIRTAIGDVAEVIGGGTPSTRDPENFGGDIPWLTPKDLAGYTERYISGGGRTISQKGLDSSAARLLPPRSVLVSSRAPVGYVAIASQSVTTNQGFRSLVLREGHVPEFFYYLLKANRGVLEANATGTTFGELSGSRFKQLEFDIPPPYEQRAIAGVLGALDDKIELNRRMNETLEQIAIAHFRSLMRKPWPPTTLGESFRVTMGQSPPGSSYNERREGVVFFQGRAEFGRRYPAPRLYCSEPTRFAKKGDALVSVRAPVGDVNVAEVDCCIGRGLAAVRHTTGSRSFSYYAMKSLSTTFSVFEGEGTVFGSINKAQFLSLPWPQVPDAEVLRFEEQAAPFDSLIELNHRQSHTLVDLRDALLPRLISGGLRVRDAEALVKREV